MVKALLVPHVLLCSLKPIGKLGVGPKLFSSSQDRPESTVSLYLAVTTVPHTLHKKLLTKLQLSESSPNKKHESQVSSTIC